MPDLRQRLAQHSAAHLAQVFEDHQLPYAPISRPEQLFDDPHLLATGGLAEVVLSDGDKAGQTAKTTLLPLRMDGERLPVRSNPPKAGEHTVELLASLGYSTAEIAAMRQQQAVA